MSATSTFDITVHLKTGGASNQFSNINREDLKALEDFFKLKGLRVKNEIEEEGGSSEGFDVPPNPVRLGTQACQVFQLFSLTDRYLREVEQGGQRSRLSRKFRDALLGKQQPVMHDRAPIHMPDTVNGDHAALRNLQAITFRGSGGPCLDAHKLAG